MAEVTQGIGKPADPGFERLARTTEALIYACMARLMLARLARMM